MEQTDDIDILLTLNPSNWSSCFISVRNKFIILPITHVFSDPYLDLVQALLDLMNGDKEVTFYLYGEPGGHRFIIRNNLQEQDKVLVLIEEFGDLCYHEPKDYELIMTFEIKMEQLITIFYLQLLKIYFLLRDKEFSVSRAENFPFQEFRKFEKLAKPFLRI